MRLEPHRRLSIVSRLRERIRAGAHAYELTVVGRALKLLAADLPRNDVQSLYASIMERLKNDGDAHVWGVLASILGSMHEKLSPIEVEHAAMMLAQGISSQQIAFLRNMPEAIKLLADSLKPADAQRLAVACVERMKASNDTAECYPLSEVIGGLAPTIGPDAAESLGKKLVQQLQIVESASRLNCLCEALGSLAPKLNPSVIQSGTAAAVEFMMKERDGFSLRQIAYSLYSLSPSLRSNDARQLSARITGRIEIEKNETIFANLGIALGSLGEQLDWTDLRPGTLAVLDRFRMEQNNDSMGILAEALSTVAPYSNQDDARLIAKSVIEKMKSERDTEKLIILGQVMASVAEKVNETDLRPGVLMLLKHARGEPNGENLIRLSLCLAELRKGLTESELIGAAEDLLAGFALGSYEEQFGSTAESQGLVNRSILTGACYFGFGYDEMPGLVDILQHASDQSIVDALKAPLLVDERVIDTIARALEERHEVAFSDNLTFIEWATADPEALALGLTLEGPGPWSVFEQPPKTVLPPLEHVEIQPVGSIKLAGAVWQFCVDGDVAYLPAGLDGLKLVDVSDPTNPQMLGEASAGPFAIGVCVAGKYAYVTAGPFGMPESHLHVVDISDVNAPRVVGSIDLPDYPSGVAVRADHVFVADHTKGLRIIHVADPNSPKEVAALDTPGFIVDVVLAGNYAFLVDREVGLRVVDVADPTSPQQVGLLKIAGHGTDLSILRKRAYYANGDNGLVVIDITNARMPKQIASIPVPFALSVSVHDNLAAIGALGTGVTVLDVTDPNAPKALGMEMSANGAAVLFRDQQLFATDVTVGGRPIGLNDHTNLRIYQVVK